MAELLTKEQKECAMSIFLANSGTTCPQGAKCKVFAQMKQKYVFKASYLEHCETYRHDTLREACRYGRRCRAYCHMTNTQMNSWNLEDRCHLAVYRHPPRDRFVSLQSGQGQGTAMFKTHEKSPRSDKRSHVKLKDSDRVVEAEVRRNGFGWVLTQPNGRPLSEVVLQKMRHARGT